MNCKPGDLAIVVRSMVRPESVGKIVRCVSFRPHWLNGEPAWLVDPPVGPEVTRDGFTFEGNWLLDSILRPIRDPGDDATDETLLWIGSPTKEAA